MARHLARTGASDHLVFQSSDRTLLGRPEQIVQRAHRGLSKRGEFAGGSLAFGPGHRDCRQIDLTAEFEKADEAERTRAAAELVRAARELRGIVSRRSLGNLLDQLFARQFQQVVEFCDLRRAQQLLLVIKEMPVDQCACGELRRGRLVLGIVLDRLAQRIDQDRLADDPGNACPREPLAGAARHVRVTAMMRGMVGRPSLRIRDAASTPSMSGMCRSIRMMSNA